eukprot:CCRYP_007445-RA/>CCRYP_007445-RA protein AED:0.38 eAED:1.00 QI:0/0/0/1/1/1/2/0/879
MFGVSRKKSKATTQRPLSFTASDDDDDDHDDAAAPRSRPVSRRKRNKRETKEKSSMLSFDPDEHDEMEKDVVVDTADDVEGDRRSWRKQSEKKHRKKHSRREKSSRSGMGYGGLIVPDNEEDEDDDGVTRSNGPLSKEEDDGPTAAAALYDKAALEKLKMEQKRRLNEASREPVLKQREDGMHDTISLDQIHAVHETGSAHNEEEEEEEEFIPLSGTASRKQMSASEPIVLTGDEAMAYATRQDDDDEHLEFDHGLDHAPPTSPPTTTMDIKGMKPDYEAPDEDMEEDTRQWEDNMARRAGVLPPSSSSADPPSKIPFASLQPTITNLENISSDLQTSLRRHESIVTSTRDEYTKHQSTLEHHGTALEYYQGLRQDLAAWMGALRLVKKMVDAVTDARMEWEGQVTRMQLYRLWEWGADVRGALVRRGLVERTMGGDEEMRDVEEEGLGVDEFGRDLSSMATMARTKRWEARRRNFLQRRRKGGFMSLQERMNCSSSDNIYDEELQEWRQRSQALTEAIGIIPSMIIDDYLSISNLCSLFFQWQKKYPDDYKSCYAEMSLVAMVSVLVRLELSQKWDGLGLVDFLNNDAKDDLPKNESMSDESQYLTNVGDFAWFSDLRRALGSDSELISSSSKFLQKVTEKCIVSRLLAYLTIDSATEDSSAKSNVYYGLYNPFSLSQTKWLCSSFKSLFDNFSTFSPESKLAESTTTKVATSLLSLLKYCVGEKPIPIVNTTNLIMTGEGFAMNNGMKEFDAETGDAIACAIYSQAKELCRLSTNILVHWYPIINDSKRRNDECASQIVQFILMEVVSMRILPILHTFQTITQESCNSDQKQTYHEMQRSLVCTVYDAVRTAGLLEQEGFMLCTAPLRVAAQAIGLT